MLLHIIHKDLPAGSTLVLLGHESGVGLYRPETLNLEILNPKPLNPQASKP